MTNQTRPPGPGLRAATGQTPERTLMQQPGRRLGPVVTASLATGVALSFALALSPVVPAEEERVRGAVLLGFAAGWAMIAVLSSRFTSTPQRWAGVPAAFMAAGGVLLLTFGASIQPVVDWVWPPAGLLLTAWVTPFVRRLPSPTGRRLLACVLALLALASVSGGYQAIGETVDARHQSMAGQLVDVGGHRLHLRCTGSGSPTVVLEPGAGEMAANLGWLAPAVTRTTRTCVYDRAGRGWSDATDSPQNGARVADDLHGLLRRAGVPGPYVLAGHSFGGLYVMAFAARYPDEVAGMVLIDSTAPASNPAPAASQGTDRSGTLERVSALLSTTSRVGVSRLYARLAFGDLPAASRDDVRASVATSSTVRSTVDEYLAGAASTRDAAALQNFGDKPLVVLTAGAGHPDSWFTAQDHLARLSTRAVHRVIPGAAHEDLVGEAEYATVTAQAIVDVVTTVRSGR